MRITATLQMLNSWLCMSDRQQLMSRLAILYGLLFLITAFVITWRTPGLLNGARGIIGGDFLAFYTAADMTLQGRALEAYDFSAFDAALQTRAPSDQLGMMWQYPPVMFLLVSPLALFPYKVSYWIWMIISAGFYAFAVFRLTRNTDADRAVQVRAIALILAAPFCVGVFANGQISLLTAGLLMSAAYRPRSEWIFAGLAAGLLTIKPQLGLLLPLAYIVVGAWRAFFLAAFLAVLMHGASVAVYGPESLVSFYEAVTRLQADVAGSGLLTPPVNMTTLFGQLRHWELDGNLAMAAQYGFAALVFLMVTNIWARKGSQPDRDLYLVALMSVGAILVTPYAYAYEMAALAPAALWITFERNRFQQFAPLILVSFWAALVLHRFLPVDFIIQLPFWVTIGVFGFLLSAARTPAESH